MAGRHEPSLHPSLGEPRFVQHHEDVVLASASLTAMRSISRSLVAMCHGTFLAV